MRPRAACGALLVALLAAATARAQSAPAPLVRGVDAIGITVGDLDRSVEFFTRVLSFEKVSETEVAGEDWERLEGVFGLRLRVARLRLGDEAIELREFLAPRGRPIPVEWRSQDRWFQHIAIVVSDLGKAYEHLRRHRVTHASSGPQRLPDWNRNAGGIQAFYFKDPEGHVLELIQFPPDKGKPKWQEAGGRLFLGIDHTAIVVADTDASLRLYRDVLGLEVAGASENWGTEQEHLNNVFGARLRITSLRAPAGPGIELLEYLSPRDGRPAPADSRACDLWHWETRLRARDGAAALGALDRARAAVVSPGLIRTAGAGLGFGRGLLVRDADGHALQIVE